MKNEDLTKEEVKTILQFNSTDVVKLLLSTVNLREKELLIINYVDITGKTQEETAEIMNCSVKTIYNHRQKALKKIGKALKNNNIVFSILSE